MLILCITKNYSGIGSQMDFIRGASLSEGAKPIIALPITTNKGESRIIPFLKTDAGLVTTRSHVHYIVTEYGIAHPNHKEHLEKQYFDILTGSRIS